MTADTFSSPLGFLDQGTGNNNNTWGDNCDLSVFATFERAIAGKNALAITGGTSDFSASGSNPPNAAHALLDYFQVLTGTLTATHTIIVANLAKSWRFINNTTGAFGVLIKTTSGTAVNIPQGRVTDITCDGANVCYRNDKEEVGNIELSLGTLNGGTFEADGSTKLIADYPSLYAKYSTTYGGNGITTFALPDTKTGGLFIRSRTGSVAVGTSQTELIKNHVHPVTGSVSISGSTGNDTVAHHHSGTTNDDTPDHTHDGGDLFDAFGTVTASNTTANFNAVNIVNSSGAGNTGGGTRHHHTFDSTTLLDNHVHSAGTLAGTLSSVTTSNNTSGGAETRPANISAIVCIRY